jgi:hypothetical protein
MTTMQTHFHYTDVLCNGRRRTRAQLAAILTRMGFKQSPRAWFLWRRGDYMAAMGGPDESRLSVAISRRLPIIPAENHDA